MIAGLVFTKTGKHGLMNENKHLRKLIVLYFKKYGNKIN
jgi:hypothetical protein